MLHNVPSHPAKRWCFGAIACRPPSENHRVGPEVVRWKRPPSRPDYHPRRRLDSSFFTNVNRNYTIGSPRLKIEGGQGPKGPFGSGSRAVGPTRLRPDISPRSIVRALALAGRSGPKGLHRY